MSPKEFKEIRNETGAQKFDPKKVNELVFTRELAVLKYNEVILDVGTTIQREDNGMQRLQQFAKKSK